MIDNKKILTIQDISCVGQCSLTVALPLLSACGLETCILPTAVLSTHTAFQHGFTLLDLTDEMNKISMHWEKENIKFSAIYSGYLASKQQIDEILAIKKRNMVNNGVLIVDPAMADNGKLYPGFNDNFPQEMLRLCLEGDIILPNITEACLLTGCQYKEKYDRSYIDNLIFKMRALGVHNIIITGVSFEEDMIGVAVYEEKENKTSYYFVKRQPLISHGTGDIYASCFTGAYLRGKSIFDSAKIAANVTAKAVEDTVDDKEHWYGVHFEKNIPYLIEEINRL